jgi:predicted Holliday junction resolvase-like endonuclease
MKKIECPNCYSELQLENVIVDTSKLNKIEYYQKQLELIEKRKKALNTAKDELYNRIYTSTKSINIGFIAERLIPAMDTFNFDHKNCRHTGGHPIDYIIFDGMADGKVTEILFVDVKTGGAILTKRQKEIQAIINEKKNVKFRTY